jgi:DNA-binding NarL/FixJ family response regulator
MSAAVLTEQQEKMLKALVRYGNHHAVAKAIGVKPGSARVYLHHLYQVIGVPNMTLAAVWYVRQTETKRRKA